MDSRKLVFKETAIVAIGQVVCISVMFGVLALLSKFDSSVLLGGVIGGIVALANFFFMALFAMVAADKAEAQDVKGGQKLMQLSQLGRYVVLIVVLFAAAKSGLCNVIALVLPLIFVRPTLTVAEFFRKSGETKA